MSPSDQEIAEYAAFAEHLADTARGQTLPHFREGAAVIDKAGPVYDPVTDADRNAERAIREMIAASFPDHGVLGEEFGESDGRGPWRWVLDPVDGTRAFICGIPTWTTLIALEYHGAPLIGVIDQAFSDERWIARPSENGSVETLFRRGEHTRLCRTSGVRTLVEARLSTTDPRAVGGHFTGEEAAAFARLSGQTRVQRFSMDAYAYALLGLGELDLVVEAGLKRHDWAALVPVVQHAGGVITNWRGEPLGADARGETLAAATPELHEAALAVLESDLRADSGRPHGTISR